MIGVADYCDVSVDAGGDKWCGFIDDGGGGFGHTSVGRQVDVADHAVVKAVGNAERHLIVA